MNTVVEQRKNAFVVIVVMSSNFPNPFWNSYLGFGLNLSGHVEGSGAADGGTRGEGGSRGGEKEGSRELHGYRFYFLSDRKGNADTMRTGGVVFAFSFVRQKIDDFAGRVDDDTIAVTHVHTYFSATYLSVT